MKNLVLALSVLSSVSAFANSDPVETINASRIAPAILDIYRNQLDKTGNITNEDAKKGAQFILESDLFEADAKVKACVVDGYDPDSALSLLQTYINFEPAAEVKKYEDELKAYHIQLVKSCL